MYPGGLYVYDTVFGKELVCRVLRRAVTRNDLAAEGENVHCFNADSTAPRNIGWVDTNSTESTVPSALAATSASTVPCIRASHAMAG